MNTISLKQFARVLFLSVVMGFGAVHAQTASIALSDTSAQIGYGFLVGGSNFGRSEFGADFLYNDDDVYLVDARLQVFDEVGSKVRGLVAGIGGKLYGASINSDSELLALGIGGMLRFAIPQNKRIIIGADGYYAPSIVTFLDADSFYEIAARLQYEVLPTAAAFLEYRKFTGEFNGKDYNLEKGFRLGIEINF